MKGNKGGSKEKKIAKKKRNVFKVVETNEKPETDEEFHRKMVQETSRKSKKKNIDLLLTNEEDDFVKDNKSHIGDGSEDEDDDLDEGDYSKFMEEMSKLDGKKQKISGARSEGGGQVSEFNLASSRGTKVIKYSLKWGLIS